ncbi:AAA family ATPase [Anaeromyxobacter sp. Red801]|uniref:AAA family ATPase n=1 Tax=Anaeromyxobacter sp. Red801 TaxID=3411632 RepID=UPI003B9ECD72
MIRSLELENFKGVAGRQRIELAPLTLLFGPNSAGKSTILQALLYLQEVLSTGSADIDRTELGGQAVDLGGFSRLVHQHDLRRTMRLRVAFATTGGLNPFHHVLNQDYLSDLDDELTDAWVEVAIAADSGTPKVQRLLVGSAGVDEPVLELWPSGTEGVAIAELHTLHPLLDGRGVLERLGDRAFQAQADRLGILVAIRAGTVVPPLDESIAVQDDFGPTEESVEARHLVEMLSVGVLRQLVRLLSRTLYLGPLRSVPPRSFLSERSRRQSGWADGMAAWDALLGDSTGTLVSATNMWLTRLGARCEVRVQDLFDPSADAARASDVSAATVRRLVLNLEGADVLPAEVGTGISQVIPVVVAALVGERKPIALIEQPELHVHPALQVALGDLFIENCGPRRQFIIETHSEHLILRILRRIRETTEKDLPDEAPEFDETKLSVLYAEAAPDGARVRRLRVDNQGEFVDKWPKGFFAERMQELL